MINTSHLSGRRIVTLVYVIDPERGVLLCKRRKPPNQGLYSPPGGKVEPDESPKQCAIRELQEETALIADPAEAILLGLVTEIGYDDPDDQWIMFLYRVRKWSGRLQGDPADGEFSFVPLGEVMDLPIPRTDREILWQRVMKGEFFDIMIDCRDKNELIVHE